MTEDKTDSISRICGKRMSGKMANSKLEEIIDLLAVYGGFNREYLRDKLLTFANDRRSENKNKMAEIARMFGKKLGEEFTVKYQTSKYGWVIEYHVAFTEKGITVFGKAKDIILRQLLNGKAVIVSE